MYIISFVILYLWCKENYKNLNYFNNYLCIQWIYQAHETAIIDKGAIISKNTKIWHWTLFAKEASIGENCSFGQNVYVGNKVKIGNNVRIQNNVSVYDEVEIEDNVFCGPSMVFTNVYNPRALMFLGLIVLKKTLVQEGATIGANATIICGTKIGFSFIAAEL